MKETPTTTLLSLPPEDYEKLKGLVRDAGCFQRTYIQYSIVLIISLLGLSLSAWIIVLTHNPWIQFFNAVFAGFFLYNLAF